MIVVTAIEPNIDLFRDDTPLLDVRAEVEFSRGAFPMAVNIPILNDAEREQVGICYKERGPEAAVRLGHALVNGPIKAERVERWRAFLGSHPGAHLYCFRGGQRSRIAATWLAETGVDVPTIAGGYKALRRLLLERLEHVPELVVVAGKTGTGKTDLLEALRQRAPANVIDLEGRANHRGSAFGKQLTPQPSQIDFENALAVDFIKAAPLVFLEDESRMIGRLQLPVSLQEKMKEAPVLLLEASLDHRIERIHAEYVTEQWHRLRATSSDEADALDRHRALFIDALDAIYKRLGGAAHKEIRAIMVDAFDAQARNDFTRHKAWIERLLVDYYDPMYEYQIERKRDRICSAGDAGEILDKAQSILLGEPETGAAARAAEAEQAGR